MIESGNFPTWLLTAISAGVAAYFGSYLKEKAQNFATKEDIEKLVAQGAAMTQATKAIEERISDEFWNKQRVWEMKRDALIELLSAVHEMADALLELSVFEESARNLPQLAAEVAPQRLERSRRYTASFKSFTEQRIVASVTCGEQVNAIALKVGGDALAMRLALEKDVTEFLRASVGFNKKKDLLAVAIREELGITTGR